MTPPAPRWLIVLPFLLFVSCGATVWKQPVEKIRSDLVAGKRQFVLSLKTADVKAADLTPLGPGAAWNLSQIFSQEGRWAETKILLDRSFVHDPSPWRQEAGKALFALYANDRDWAKAELVARKLVGENNEKPWATRLLFESLYFQKKDAPARELFDRWTLGLFSPAQERENRLFAAVLDYRAGKTEAAAEALKALVFREPASILQFRLESFFEEDPTRYDLLGPWGREAVAFQSLAYRAVPAQVLTWLEATKLPTEFWQNRALVESLEGLFKAEPRAETGLRLLEGFRKALTGEAKFAAEYARGRFYRTLGRWNEARAAFQAARPLAVRPDDKQKTAWNWLNSWVQLEPNGALGPFLQVYSETTDAAYFQDVFEDWMTALVQERNWKLLAAAWRDLGKRLPATERTAAGFVLARLASGGFVDLSALGINASAKELLESVVEVDPFRYESMVARAALGLELAWPERDSEPPADPERGNRMLLWNSALEFGLVKQVTDQIVASPYPLEPEFVLKTALKLQERGQYRPSLLVIYRHLKDPGAQLTRELAKVLYPRAFQPLVETRAAAENLDPNLLWGLMREESSFDPAAKSWVGAQGLTQLMPATAAETAKRLKMKTYDLASPQDNITIGAYYLASMIRSQEQIFLALMAYNAGGGRIKPWKAELGRLPVEIFVEAAPITETRNYVKRILVSTVMYGVLHHGKTLGEMVRLVYPNFQP